MVLGFSPESRYIVELVPVFSTTVDQVVPLSVDLSIMYPAIKLPLLLGAFQFKLICDDDTAVAVRPVGDNNVVASCVVADAVLDGALVPTELIADTL